MREAGARQTASHWTIRGARSLAQVTGLAMLLALGACSADGATSPTQSSNTPVPYGNYAISTVNGKALPVALAQDGAYSYEVTNGTLALSQDGKFSIVTTYRQTITDNVSIFVDSTGGTWSISGNTVTLKNSADGTTDTGTWETTQLTFVETVNNVTTTSVYTKK
jgi:flagellar basal body rod protein FlgG